MGVCLERPRVEPERREAAEAEAEVGGTGYFVLTEAEFDKFEQCMTTPAHQTPLMQAAATLHARLLAMKHGS